MNDDEKKLMQAYGITSARKNVCSYKEFKYERLADAIRYAQIENGDSRMNGVSGRTDGHQRCGRTSGSRPTAPAGRRTPYVLYSQV